MFSYFKNIIGFIKKTPKYLKEILNNIFNSSINKYNNPFSKKIFIKNEFFFLKKIIITKILFISSKSYSLKKNKKIGRVKRKIFKKINIINNIVD
jgi:hypothetical protein